MKNRYVICVKIIEGDTYIYKFDRFSLDIIRIMLSGYELQHLKLAIMEFNFDTSHAGISKILSQILYDIKNKKGSG